MSEPLTPEAESLYEWLCKTARYSPTGAWGREVRRRLATIDAAWAANDVDYKSHPGPHRYDHDGEHMWWLCTGPATSSEER